MPNPEVARRPRTKGYALRLALRDAPKPWLTWILIAANALYFLFGVGFMAESDDYFRGGALYGPGTLLEPWRLLSCGFIHAGLMHILFNMSALMDIGALLEKGAGKLRFSIIYFVSLLAGSVASSVWSPLGLSVGASGAILGLAGGLFVYGRQFLENPEDRQTLRKNMLVWLVFLTGLGLILPLDNAAHIGGFVGGMVSAWILAKGPATRGQAIGRLGAAIGLMGLMLGAWFLAEKRVASDPLAQARVFYLKGLALQEDQDKAGASEAFRQAVELSPERAFLRRAALAEWKASDPEGLTPRPFDDWYKAEDQAWMPYIDERLQFRNPTDRLKGTWGDD